MLRHPSPMIHITYWLTIVLTAAMTVGYAVTFSLGAALLSGILTVLLVMTYFAIRSRIPFAAALLESVTATAVRFNGTLIAALVGLLVSGAYSALWIASVVGVEGYMAGERGRGGFGVWLLLAGMILLLLWTLEVIRNTVAVTVSGTFASVYFGGVEVHDPDGGGRVTVQVPGEKGKSVTAGAAKRAMTTSFGSVCFASLLVALLQALRGAVRVAEQDSQGNICMMCLTWCCQCILGIIQGMLEYFNKFAFTQVAIYGKGYVQAAKDTWNMIKYRGFDAVINTSLVGNVLSIGSLFCGLCCGLFGWLLAIDGGAATDSSYLSRALFICIASAVIGTWVFLIVIEVINAGVATTYVCLAMEPGVIRNKQPALFDKFARTYPQIMTGV
ncbi:putative choline transporter, neither null mutation nor overexpression affects choline transport [Irineochytrium annulatum]|nr:putative choline transporter, neither null mutation nor overexpression affects choline transport [Irineochytrium annulatum]